MDTWVNLTRDDRMVFLSRVDGRGESPLPLTVGNLLGVLGRYPLSTMLTMPRIMFEAMKLHYVKQMKVYTKPSPVTDETWGMLQ